MNNTAVFINDLFTNLDILTNVMNLKVQLLLNVLVHGKTKKVTEHCNAR